MIPLPSGDRTLPCVGIKFNQLILLGGACGLPRNKTYQQRKQSLMKINYFQNKAGRLFAIISIEWWDFDNLGFNLESLAKNSNRLNARKNHNGR
jgi:hypothetical protein